MNIYDEIKSKVLLSSVIGESVQLNRKGNTYIGLCPFHSEKTPSFTVSDQKGIYYCFGCHSGGDVINFLEKNLGYSHSDALNFLCNRLGIEINPGFVNKDIKNNNLFLITNFVMNWYQNELLKNQELLSYLKSRNISDDSIKKFGLGYSSNNSELISILEKKYSESDIVNSGLFRKRESGLYSFFYNRLMFPIIDSNNRVIAFGGRVIGKDSGGPKYINCSETDIFVKRQALFNIQNVKNLKKDQDIFIVEGYIDVIALDSIGVKAVAPLGTALSDYHINILWKINDNPILCFDGDLAGKKSALLAAEKILLLLRIDKRVSFVFLPDGKDPDDFVHGFDYEEARINWDKLSDQKLSLGNFIWENVKSKYLLDSSPESKLNAVNYVNQITSGIKDPNVKHHYVDFFNKEIKYYSSKKNRFSINKSTINSLKKRTENESDLKSLFLDKRLEIQILAMLIYHPRLIDENLDFISSMNFSHDILNILRDNILSTRFESSCLLSADSMIKNLFNFVFQNDSLKEVLEIMSYITGNVFKSTYLWTDFNFDPNESWLEVIEIYRKQNFSNCNKDWDSLVDMIKSCKSK